MASTTNIFSTRKPSNAPCLAGGWVKPALLVLLTAGVILIIALTFAGKELSRCSDFYSFYVAGNQLRTGHATGLYNASSYPAFSPYVRAPWEAVLFTPFTFLPYTVAFVLWDTLSVLLFLLSGWLLLDEIKTAMVVRNSLFYKLAFAGLLFPVGVTLAAGQDAALFLLLIVLAIRSIRNGNEADAGILLGLASIKLQLLIPLFILLIIRRKWRILYGVAETGILLFLISTAIAGPHWVSNCIAAQSNVADQMGQTSFRYVLSVVGLGNMTTPILLVGIIISLWLVRRMPLEVASSWMIVAAIFFNWHSMIYDYASALPAIVLSGGELKINPQWMLGCLDGHKLY